MSAQFKFLSGARVGQVETFRKAYIGLGRHPLSDVRCDAERDLDVSSRHAGIVRHGASFVLRDLGSMNGTFVNGQRVRSLTALQSGDLLGVGTCQFVVDLGDLEKVWPAEAANPMTTTLKLPPNLGEQNKTEG